MSKPELRLDWCSHQAAKYAVEHWHYSRVVPHQKTVKVGVWEDNRFVGCVLFGNGANNHLGKPYGLKDTEVCELVRIALSDHQTPVSRIVRLAFRFLKSASPGIRLVISFADPEQGHHGGIYQAGNWIYAGPTLESDEYIVSGNRMHGRALRSTRSTHRLGKLPAKNVMEWARQVLDPNIRKVSGSSKYRYLYQLDAVMRTQIEPLRQPYPKRAGSVDSDTPAVHAGEDSATLIPALQTSQVSDG